MALPVISLEASLAGDAMTNRRATVCY